MVVDASVAVDWLLGLERGQRLSAVVRREQAAAPHLIDAEVGQVLRRLARTGYVRPSRAREALADLEVAPLLRYPHGPLMRRAWDLRENCTFYDGLYLALAEALDVRIITGDRALAQVPGFARRVLVV